jgi:hypothetical protein
MSTIGTSTKAFATMIGNNSAVFITDDGTALVLWFDGTNTKFSYASSPYTSWTAGTLITGLNVSASGFLESSGNVSTVSVDTNENPNYKLLTKSGATYSAGSATLINSSFLVVASQGQPFLLTKDSQGRYWAIANNDLGTKSQVYWSSTPTTASWTSSLTATAANNTFLPASDIVGNYLVVVYPTGSTTFKYQRIDTSAGSLGAWDAASTITLVGPPDNTINQCFRGNGLDTGMLVYQSGTGMYASQYTASTNTWGSGTQISSGANDTEPTLVTVDHDLYCFWCEYHAASNFALVYKKWSYATNTWDTSATTLVASGTNIHNPNAGYNSPQATIGVSYTVGTANPWSVNFATVSVIHETTLSASGRFTMAWGIDPPLSLYGLQAAGSVLTTAAKLGSDVGGISATKTTLVGTAQNYGELWSLGKTTAWNAVTSIPAPTGHGFLLDSTILEGNVFNAGNWTVAIKLALNATFTTFTGTLVGRLYKRSSGGVYTQIGSNMSVAANLTATATVYTLTGTGFPSMSFALGDRFYMDLWMTVTTTGGATTRTIALYGSSHATLGIANQMQVTTPGYIIGHTLKASGRFVLSGPLPLTIYGSSVADGTLTTAGAMTLSTGGTETSKVSTYSSGSGNFGEVLALGGSLAAVAAIPATPTGKGWIYSTGAGTFAAEKWSAVINLANTGANGAWTLRFFRRTSGGTYTSIGTISGPNTATAKTAVTFPATSMSSIVFASGDRLYIDLWYQDATGAASDNATVYESTSATAGVVSDMQITTATFIPAVSGTTLKAVGRFRTVAETIKNAVGRVSFVVKHTLDATGRFVTQAGHTLDAAGRFKLAAATSSTKDAIGRFRMVVQNTREGMGRVAFKVARTQNASGRASFVVRHTLEGLGRASFRAGHTLLGMGRAAFKVGHTLIGMGRAAFKVARTRDASGRTTFVVRHTLEGAGRASFRAGHTLSGLGRFILVSLGAMTRKAVGRFTLVARSTRQGVGRAVFAVRHTFSTSGRAIFRAPHTLLSAGRWKMVVARTRQGVGRANFTAPRTLRGVGRAIFRVSHTLDASGRAAFKVALTRDGAGRFKVGVGHTWKATGRTVLRAGHTLEGVGRFVLAVSGTMTRKAVGRFTLIVHRTLDSAGRFKIGIEHLRSAAGRVVYRASHTQDGMGRFKYVVLRTLEGIGRFKMIVSRRLSAGGRASFVVHRTLNSQGRAAFKAARQRIGQGRAVFVARRTLSGSGRLSLGISHRLSSSGRAKFRAERFLQAIGRFALVVQGAVTRQGRGRFMLSVERKRQASGRFAVRVASYSTITVTGPRGIINVVGPRGTLTVVGTRGTLTIEEE